MILNEVIQIKIEETHHIQKGAEFTVHAQDEIAQNPKTESNANQANESKPMTNDPTYKTHDTIVEGTFTIKGTNVFIEHDLIGTEGSSISLHSNHVAVGNTVSVSGILEQKNNMIETHQFHLGEKGEYSQAESSRLFADNAHMEGKAVSKEDSIFCVKETYSQGNKALHVFDHSRQFANKIIQEGSLTLTNDSTSVTDTHVIDAGGELNLENS